ncbi:MAG: DUF1553 domain-containing protein, partial [Planctomycetaceae bacterium]
AGPSADFGLSASAPEADRRRELAEWITHPDNPLTARVIVNRLWHYHFGTGIVDTPSDLGFNGGRPSHPELLDWLAAVLMGNAERGMRNAEWKSIAPAENSALRTPNSALSSTQHFPWSLKHIHRLIVTSATYRQCSNAECGVRSAEPERSDSALSTQHSAPSPNRLLRRFPPRRLDAEAVRDAVLAVSGELNPRMGGPGFQEFTLLDRHNDEYEFRHEWSSEHNRRTVYRTWVRSGPNRLLDVLDCPDPTVATPDRTVTTTPLQALSLLNNEFMLDAAEHTAERLRRDVGDDVNKQITRLYQLAFCRSPVDAEMHSARRFVEEHGLDQLCLVVFNANEFLYVD